MAMQTKCPNCQNVLKLKSDSAVGRNVPCPKCGTPFTIKLMSTRPKAKPKPQPEDEWEDEYDYGNEDDAYDDYDDGGSYEDDYDAPPKRSSKSSKSKKKKAAGTPKWLVGAGIGGGVVLVLALLVGGIGFLISNLGGGGGNVINLAWLPENADMFIYMRPNEIVNAPMLAPVRDSEFVKMAMAQAKAQGDDMPFEVKDIETVTLAGVDMVDMYKQRTAIFGARLGQPQLAQRANPKMVSVFRLSRDFSEAEFNIPTTREHNGRKLFVRNTPQGDTVLCVIDPRTILAGEASQVTAALDRGATEPRVKRIDFVNADHQLVLMMAPPTVLQPTADKPGTSPAVRLENAMNKGARAGYLALSVRTDLEMEVGFDSFGSSEAQEIQDTLDSMLTEGKGRFETSTAQVPPQFQEFVAIGRDTMNSINVKRSGNNVVVTGRVPGRIVAAVQDAIANNPFAGMMMQGMMQQMQQQSAPGGATSPGTTNPGAASPGMMSPGATDPGAAVTPSGSPEDADMEALQAEREQTQGTLDGIRGTIKQTTGNIQQAVPGGQ